MLYHGFSQLHSGTMLPLQCMKPCSLLCAAGWLLSSCKLPSRRVELVLLHGPESEPEGTAAWLQARPHLARHHHIRLTHPKV